MARIRTIKPEFFTSEDIVALSPLARLLYVATWCEADKEGRLVWKPRTFKLRYFPGDDCDIEALCAELVKSGLVVPYAEGLAYIPQFTKHQHVNPRESASTLPEPNTKGIDASRRGATRQHACTPGIDPQVGREGKGKERKGKEPASGDASRFGDFWDAWPKSERKQDRKKCAEKWQANGLDALADEILADVAVKKRTQKWQEAGGKFIEAPEVYLNNRRWEDGVVPLDAAVEVESMADYQARKARERQAEEERIANQKGPAPEVLARLRGMLGAVQ